MRVYEKVPISEAWSTTGRAPIAVRWIDTNKGDARSPVYRSRLVAKEFKTSSRPDLFAATPPSECLKLLLSKLAGKGKGYKLLYADVSRAYFYARAIRPVYVRLPEEDQEEGDVDRCGRLLMSMYGTRDAAQNWSSEYAKTLVDAGFVRGKANPCLFSCASRDASVMVHGDDFVAVGPAAATAYVSKILGNKYKLKMETLGMGSEDVREVRILNKLIRINAEGVHLEADPRHAERVIREMGVEDGKSSPVPGSKVESKKQLEKERRSHRA